MKKVISLCILFIALIFAGCQNEENSANTIGEQNNVPDYTPSSEDVVDMHGEIENKERFEEFLNNVEKNQKDSIRVVSYTTEGDPMLKDLEYDGGVIKYTTDTRRDKFGVGSISNTSCTSVEVVETTERTDYLLEGCDNKVDNIILVTWK
ncbi:DUF4362 domain-containing protein [Psychrobacillus sp. INOP01]|uniref:DUF4362 domain-containing protein n=1 Tax=Psychrobacillus sp. INOP01 TaxID=2829187 RepID=UPI001BA98577|nr:DUF4362 domain-containing protein [Psychrobacillus sp. INOP01]QUG40052.1 DUF4362 domain-containing protein [Psychrobacillus sp. INOP01]